MSATPVAVAPLMTSDHDFLAGGGEMGALIREHDWTATPLGPPAGWPHSLKTVLRIMLASRYAMWLGWGENLVFFCNDAYSPTLGVKHPWALGRPAQEVWTEVWNDAGPRIASVLRTGEATWDQGLLLFLERRGYPEETYHTFSYSPLPGDTGGVAGMLCVVTEETERVIGERRLSSLRELAAGLSGAQTMDEVTLAVCRSLETNLKDLPFSLIYLFDNDGGPARLTWHAGVGNGHPLAPETLDPGDPDTAWPIGTLLAQGQPLIVSDLPGRFGALPVGAWDKAPRDALLVPVARHGQERPAGVLIAGINPYRPLDAAYEGFLSLFAGQIAAAVAGVRAFDEERRRAEALAELGRARRQAAEREQRLRAEAEAMRARVETLIEHLPVGAALFDTQSRILVSNAPWRRFNPGARLRSADPNQSRWSGIHDDGRPIETADLPAQRALRGDVVRAQELRFRGDDGLERWVEVSAIPVRDADGAVVGAVGVILDIDDARRAETALRESEERFRVAADSAPILIGTTDAEGRLTFTNKWHEERFGLSPADIETGTWRRVIHAEDVDDFFAAFRAAFQRRIPFRREVRVFDREGSPRWLRCDGTARFDGTGAFLGYTVVSVDVTDSKLAAARQHLLIAELNHRVKNTLATVQSLAQQSLRSTDAPPSFATAFSSRLLALARAHDLLTREEWDGATLADVAAAALAPWLDSGRIVLDGPRIRLVPKHALALSMAFGELATNAAKHGALSVPSGQVSLAWQQDGGGAVALEWVEDGGPAVRPPTRRGLGSRLLGRPLAAELGGTVDVRFDPAGLRCVVSFPARIRVAA